MKTWQLQEAKARFSEVVKNAVAKGPQNITVHGEAVAVVISKGEFDRLTKPKLSFVKFMRNSPLVGIKLDVKRDKSTTRDMEL